jgi:surface antigen
MQKISLFPVLIIITMLLSSCAGKPSDPFAVQPGHKGQAGALVGAGGGALLGQAIGHNTEATLIGAAVGTMLGYIVGNEMDKYDKRELNHAYEKGISGQTSSWQNPDTGEQRQVTPQRTYINPASSTGEPCRVAKIASTINGEWQTIYTTACRDYSGQWHLQN